MAKIILIYGPRYGKTTIANALLASYRSQNIAAKLITAGSKHELANGLKDMDSFNGFILVTTNCWITLLDGYPIWQSSLVEGGCVLKQADLRDMANVGIGEPVPTLYGAPLD